MLISGGLGTSGNFTSGSLIFGGSTLTTGGGGILSLIFGGGGGSSAFLIGIGSVSSGGLCRLSIVFFSAAPMATEKKARKPVTAMDGRSGDFVLLWSSVRPSGRSATLGGG